MISSTFWTPEFRNNHIPYKLHYYFIYISISFLYFLSSSARNKGNKNVTGTGFQLKDVTKFMEFRVFESALGNKRVISCMFWTP